MSIDVEVGPDGEECGPIVITFIGGVLRVRGDGGAAITINGERGGCLSIDNYGTVVAATAPAALPLLPDPFSISP